MEQSPLGHNKGPLRHVLKVEEIRISSLRHFANRPRRHPAGQLQKLLRSLETYGQVLPILIDAENRIVAGEAVVAVLSRLECPVVQAVRVTDLSEVQTRALRLALNRNAEGAEWDPEALKMELQSLLELNSSFDLTLTGLDTGELDLALTEGGADSGFSDDEVPCVPAPTAIVTAPGDLWNLGPHRLYSGSSLEPESYRCLLGNEILDLVLTDPPYNVPIQGHVSGKGKAKHKEFAMASGEMDEAAFLAFLRSAFLPAVTHSRKGALLYSFMDWRHLSLLQDVARDLGLEPLNLCVWVKTNPGMGSFYRSQHELVLVAKKPGAAHCNNIQLGRFGRNRSNVWTCPGANSFGNERDGMLAAHPTVKPVSLLADIIQDASNRGDLVLDPFAGSGSTLIAAERLGRICRLIEIDPRYCDVILERYQRYSGQEAVLAATGETFASRKLIALERVKGGDDA